MRSKEYNGTEGQVRKVDIAVAPGYIHLGIDQMEICANMGKEYSA